MKGPGATVEDWPDRTLGLRVVEPARAAAGKKRKRAHSNSPCGRRWTQTTSGVAMAANATTNPSQLLPLGNAGPVGNGGEEVKLGLGGPGAVG